MTSATPLRKPRKDPRTGRPPGPAPDPTARRSDLLDAAARTIRRVGQHASMDDIAAEAGLTKPILYANFGDKAGLAAALAERVLEQLLPDVLAAFDTDGDPRAMVRSAIDTFIAFVDDDPEVFRFLVRGVGAADRAFIEQRLIARFGLQLAEVVRTSVADAKSAELFAFSVLGTVLAGAEWWQATKAVSRRQLVDRLTTFVWGGLVAGGVEGLGSARRRTR